MTELVSGLMVTRNRVDLARRAVACFGAQTWTNAQLVILDDGDQDYGPMLRPFMQAGMNVKYVRLPSGGVGCPSRSTLGELRNQILDLADGDWLIQWDDDEWYHPDRIRVQVEAGVASRAVAVALRWTLVHLESGPHAGSVFLADTGFATPGTILHRPTEARYPDESRGEDSVFLQRVRRTGRVEVLGKDWSHLFVRCFHGANTWDQRHFEARLRRRVDQWPSYVAARLRGDLTKHRAFRLTEREAATAKALILGRREPIGRPVSARSSVPPEMGLRA